MNNKTKPMLSIGMIVKNEKRCLEKCLKALQPLRDTIPCELVIADTGSTDNTKEIASKYADILFDFEWINDFAAARNAVMDKCSGKWYLSIDADEYMDESTTQEMVKFFNNPLSNEIDAAYITINNYQDANDESQYVTFYAFRMARMETGARFKGAVHEVIDDNEMKKVTYLKECIFWHDGYLQIDELKNKNKKQRNIKILEKILSEDPDNLFKVYQAYESSYKKEDKIKYVYKMIELVEKNVENTDKLADAIYRYAINTAWEYRLPEFSKWCDIAFEKYPNSLYTKVDVNYLALLSAENVYDCNKIVEYAEKYLYEVTHLDETELLNVLKLGPFVYGGDNYKEMVIVCLSKAYMNLGDYKKAKQIIKDNFNPNISSKNINQFISMMYLLWDKIDLSDIFSYIYELFYKKIEENLDNKIKDKKNIFEQVTKYQFLYKFEEEISEKNAPKEPAYKLIASLGDCDLALAARIMLSEDENDIIKLSESIKSWIDLPKNVFAKIMQYKIILPYNFYCLSIDNMKDIAGQYVTDLDKKIAVITVLDWLNSVNKQSYPKDIVWRYDLIIAAMRVANWEEDYCEYREELLAIYIKSTEHFLNLYYNNSVLCEDLIDMIPSMHAFAWFVTKYNQEKLNNNLQQCIYWLKKALKIAPVMKSMVKYLLKNIENEINKIPEEVNPELLALAEKVRTILSAYPQDDPAVFAIKQSEVYKKVAYLIEKPASDYKM